jgi:hypothetical protein
MTALEFQSLSRASDSRCKRICRAQTPENSQLENGKERGTKDRRGASTLNSKLAIGQAWHKEGRGASTLTELTHSGVVLKELRGTSIQTGSSPTAELRTKNDGAQAPKLTAHK